MIQDLNVVNPYYIIIAKTDEDTWAVRIDDVDYKPIHCSITDYIICATPIFSKEDLERYLEMVKRSFDFWYENQIPKIEIDYIKVNVDIRSVNDKS